MTWVPDFVLPKCCHLLKMFFLDEVCFSANENKWFQRDSLQHGFRGAPGCYVFSQPWPWAKTVCKSRRFQFVFHLWFENSHIVFAVGRITVAGETAGEGSVILHGQLATAVEFLGRIQNSPPPAKSLFRKCHPIQLNFSHNFYWLLINFLSILLSKKLCFFI